METRFQRIAYVKETTSKISERIENSQERFWNILKYLWKKKKERFGKKNWSLFRRIEHIDGLIHLLNK
jgi:hypothetical protein